MLAVLWESAAKLKNVKVQGVVQHLKQAEQCPLGQQQEGEGLHSPLESGLMRGNYARPAPLHSAEPCSIRTVHASRGAEPTHFAPQGAPGGMRLCCPSEKIETVWDRNIASMKLLRKRRGETNLPEHHPRRAVEAGARPGGSSRDFPHSRAKGPLADTPFKYAPSSIQDME